MLKPNTCGGTYGLVITSSIIKSKTAQYPTRYSASRVAELNKCVTTHRGCDCAGLIKWFLWSENDAHDIKYNSKTDRNCTGLYNAATEKGSIDNLPEIPGLILYKSGHVGVYVGNGEAVECTLGSYGDGVVKTKVKGRGWTDWLKIPEIEYIEEKKEEPKPVTTTATKKKVVEQTQVPLEVDYSTALNLFQKLNKYFNG